MRFTSIYLSNYIGIYNGMGLYDIHIDLSKCQNRIVIIRGDNGSGKSTLSKAMSLFPDPNDSFIPGFPARKEIILTDGPTMYKLVFIHGIKQNGERDTTKAYITKTFNNTAVELNENGNVSSYKEILYSELGLDSNFAALSQLSNDDRGLADKRPAERKRFVNSIISSLETYNNIYKTLTKRSSNFKSMINSIAAKLNVLGDESVAISNLEDVENRINHTQDLKDQALVALAMERSKISLLDPDGSIQNLNTVIRAELDIAEKENSKIQAIIDSLITSNKIQAKDIDAEYKRVIDSKNSLIIQNQISRNGIESLINQRESEAQNLNQKIQKLSALNSSYNYDATVERLTQYRTQLKDIELELSKTGIVDIKSISKEEYILALETLKDLETYISVFKSTVNFDIIQKIISEYLATGAVPKVQDPNAIMNRMATLDREYELSVDEMAQLESRIELMKKLDLRPIDCASTTCPFIKDALEISKTNPKERYDALDALLYSIRDEMDLVKKNHDDIFAYNDAINKFSIIVREIDKNGAILSKMPNGEMFKNKAIFFDRLLSGYGFEYMRTIYGYIDLANLFDTYRQIDALCREYESDLKIYESKSDIIYELQEDIDRINKSISAITDKIEPINNEIADRERIIAQLQELEGVYSAILDQLEKQKPVHDKIIECKNKLSENSKKINEINAAIARVNTISEDINKYNFTLAPLMKERDKLNHSIQMMKDYKREKDELQVNYDFIETIKYYSSPTTGIQLVFMELYMGKIISLANELLKLLFGGQFVIQPFVINESEFRIPCLGNGYLNDDISSMSSSQIGMISMILSFALLHHSSTKYNIIKLDEIDGPLDYSNRLFFTDVLNNIMDIMGTEQCIMISHNSELQVDNSDVILLRHDENNMDYLRGNIIWKY